MPGWWMISALMGEVIAGDIVTMVK